MNDAAIAPVLAADAVSERKRKNHAQLLASHSDTDAARPPIAAPAAVARPAQIPQAALPGLGLASTATQNAADCGSSLSMQEEGQEEEPQVRRRHTRTALLQRQVAGGLANASTTRRALEQLRLAFLGARGIALHTHVLAVAGGAGEAVLLSQLIYWTRHGTEVVARDGWLFKTAEQWERETGLATKVQRRVRRNLRSRGLLSERAGGLRNRMESRLELTVLAALVAQRIRLQLQRPLNLELFVSDAPAVREFLGPVVVYQRLLMTICPTVEDALLLSRLIRLQQERSSGECVWLEHGRDQWLALTGLTRTEFETARRHLQELGVVLARLLNFPKRIALLLDVPRLAELVCTRAADLRQLATDRRMANLGRQEALATSLADDPADDDGDVPAGSPMQGVLIASNVPVDAGPQAADGQKTLTNQPRAGFGGPRGRG